MRVEPASNAAGYVATDLGRHRHHQHRRERRHGGDFRLLNGPFTPSTLNGFNGVVSFSATGKPIKTMSNFDPVILTGSGDETFA